EHYYENTRNVTIASRVGDRSDPQKQTKIVCAFICIVHFTARSCSRLRGDIWICQRYTGLFELVDHNSFGYFFITRSPFLLQDTKINLEARKLASVGVTT